MPFRLAVTAEPEPAKRWQQADGGTQVVMEA
jgi:hypothetical protein